MPDETKKDPESATQFTPDDYAAQLVAMREEFAKIRRGGGDHEHDPLGIGERPGEETRTTTTTMPGTTPVPRSPARARLAPLSAIGSSTLAAVAHSSIVPVTTGDLQGIVAVPGVGYPLNAAKVNPWEVQLVPSSPGDHLGAPYDWTRPVPIPFVLIRGQLYPDITASNQVFHDAYLDRYGHRFDQSGTPSIVPGYANELLWVNRVGLENWAKDLGNTHPQPKMAEVADIMWSQGRGTRGFYFTYFVSRELGGIVENPRHENVTTHVHGAYTIPHGLINSYTEFVFNDGDLVVVDPPPVDPPPVDPPPVDPPPVDPPPIDPIDPLPPVIHVVVDPARIEDAKVLLAALKPGKLKQNARRLLGELIRLRDELSAAGGH